MARFGNGYTISGGGSSTSTTDTMVVKGSASVNFKTATSHVLYTVPSGKLLFIEKIMFSTYSITSPGNAPYVSIGNSSQDDYFTLSQQIVSNAQYETHIINYNSNAIPAGTQIKAIIGTASTASVHNGEILFSGFLRDV